MGAGLLLDCDQHVVKWIHSVQQWPIELQCNRAIGIVDKEGKLCGAILFHFYNGYNVELSYYGANTLSPGIIRFIVKFALNIFNVSRLTVSVSKRKRRLMQSLQRLGFKLEGAQRCYYGHRDCNRNTAVRFVMFRDRLEQLAGIVKKEAA